VLEHSNVEVIYSRVILAVKDITLAVPKAGCVALLGGNGAGKSTTLKAISNLIKTEDGSLTGGTILFEGDPIENIDPATIPRRGLIHVMEGRRVLHHMTVEQNLIVGGNLASSTRAMRLAWVYDRIPRLAQLKTRTAGYLSGGEQQMMVIGRAMMADPKLIMIDEPSLGLAPMMVAEVFALLKRLKRDGLTLFIVEQNTQVALDIANTAMSWKADASCSKAPPPSSMRTRPSASSTSASISRRTQELPRRQAFSPPQALARLSGGGAGERHDHARGE
jgi:branched-chain amino acid transport system ATP-binding protein